MFYRNRNIAATFTTLRLHLQLVRALQIADRHQKCLIHKDSDSFQIGRLRLSTEAYTSTLRCCSGQNWSKFGVHNMRQKTTPNVALNWRTAIAPHKQQQPPKFRDAPHAVRDNVGCSRQRSQASGCDSRGVFGNSQWRAGSTNPPRSQTHFNSRAGA